MNPVFWALVALTILLLWFLLSGLYKWIGKLFSRVWHDSIDQFTENEEENNNNDERDNEK